MSQSALVIIWYAVRVPALPGEEKLPPWPTDPPARPPPPRPTADQRRIAQDSFTKAREAIASDQLDYAITLLLTACRLDPGNFLYRQTLRKTQKDKFGNNLRGSRLAFLTTPRWKARDEIGPSAAATI